MLLHSGVLAFVACCAPSRNGAAAAPRMVRLGLAAGQPAPRDERWTGALDAPAAAAGEVLDLSLAEAVALGLARHPALAATDEALSAQRHDVSQGQRWTNPSVSVDVENFAGAGSVSGYDNAETTLWLQQTLQLPGRRRARRRSGEAAVRVSEVQRDLAALDVAAQVESAFVSALAAEDALELARLAEALAAEFHDTVAQLAEAGKVAALEGQKAAIAQSSAQLERRRAERRLAVARVDLEYAIGGDRPIGRLLGSLDVRTPPSDLEELRTRLHNGPRLGRWEAEFERAEAEVTHAGALRNTMSVSVGVRRLSATDDTAAVASLSLPLPVMDRRHDAVRAARARKTRVQHQRRRDEQELTARLERAWRRLQSTFDELTSLDETLLPPSERALADVLAGYRAGKFELLAVLDSQRTLFELRARHIAALREHRLAEIEVRAVTGANLP